MADEKRIIFSDRILKIMSKLEDIEMYIAYELSWMASKSSVYKNIMNISKMDISKNPYSIDCTIDGKVLNLKWGVFIRTYFPDFYDDAEISEFIKEFAYYSKMMIKDGRIKDIDVERGTPIEVVPFKYNPKDPRSTFLSLVTKTYPHGLEEEVLEFLPALSKDGLGNYFKIIPGDDTTMFTSHLDTADRSQKVTKLLSKVEGGDEYIYTDGSSILGADDKSGVTVMLYMMAHNIPGIYYFFMGEERGGIGSRALSVELDTFDALNNVNKCISFDRRKTGSIITHQMGRQCCSDTFGTALCKQYNKSGLSLSLDTGGVFTDSASFIDDFSECTNVSVGYNFEHTEKEIQNMTYLDKLCKASLKVEWAKLPANRKVGLNQELVAKHKKMILEVKDTLWELDVKLVGMYDRIFIKIDVGDEDVENIYETIVGMESLLNKYKIRPDVVFDDSFIKIELL